MIFLPDNVDAELESSDVLARTVPIRMLRLRLKAVKSYTTDAQGTNLMIFRLVVSNFIVIQKILILNTILDRLPMTFGGPVRNSDKLQSRIVLVMQKVKPRDPVMTLWVVGRQQISSIAHLKRSSSKDNNLLH